MFAIVIQMRSLKRLFVHMSGKTPNLYTPNFFRKSIFSRNRLFYRKSWNLFKVTIFLNVEKSQITKHFMTIGDRNLVVDLVAISTKFILRLSIHVMNSAAPSPGQNKIRSGISTFSETLLKHTYGPILLYHHMHTQL